MTSQEVRDKYLKFFKDLPRSHKEISPAPLVLENDPTTLFTSSGMQPLVPYLMGKSHPEGKRLVDSQPSIRTVDIDEVGDNRHLTFFEMLGNWSLGDYFKKEQIRWIFEFLTNKNEGLGLEADRLYVTIFGGEEGFSVNGKLNQLSPDIDSLSVWRDLFNEKNIDANVANNDNQAPDITKGRIFYYGAEKNWWSRAGTPQQMPVGEIGGPDSEIFYDFDPEKKLKIHENSIFKDNLCHPNCECGRFLEIGNSVFIQYKKVGEKELEELPQKNVDFGGGLERITTAVNGEPDIYKTGLFLPIINQLEERLEVKYETSSETTRSLRIIADHLKASVFLITNGVMPDNKLQGYVLRRLLRRSALKAYLIKESFDSKDFKSIVRTITDIYPDYFKKGSYKKIEDVISLEVRRFRATVERGYKEIEKQPIITGKIAFDLYQSYGFPLELTEEITKDRGQRVDRALFKEEFDKHRNLSRTTSAGVFKGGLADHSQEVIRLHTATHLLLASLRKVLGDHVVQKGQNITKERSRFDFPNSEKLTKEQLKEVEDIINEVVEKNIPVNFRVMPKEEALKTGAIHAFNEMYADTVKVYFVGKDMDSAFSKEFCGGPHVKNTSEIGRVKIKKQERIGSGLIRIYATIE